MKILSIEHFDKYTLIEKLQTITLNTPNEHVKIYAKSEIDLYTVSGNIQDQIYPCQYYLMHSELEKVRELNYRLKEHGFDMFQLDGYLTIKLELPNQGDIIEIDLLPPIVEVSSNEQNPSTPLVCDGMHRLYLAMLEYTPCQIVYINRSPIMQDYPYYAYPIPNFQFPGTPNWNAVKVYDKLPNDSAFIKRWPRIENHKSLYRNFNAVFTGVSGRHTK